MRNQSRDSGNSGALKLLGKTLALMVKRCPKEALLISIFTLLGGAFAGIITYCWKILFQNAYGLIDGTAAISSFLLSFLLIFGVYILQNAFNIISRIYQPGFMEQIKFSLLSEIHEKVDTIPMEYYEDPSLYDTIHRAGDIVSGGSFMRFFLNMFSSVSNLLSVASVSIVLATFNPWLILLCLISVIPPFAARLIRGRRYYYMKVYQTPKIRIQNYLWSLLVSRDSVKEARVFGFGEYLKEKWAGYKRDLQNEEWEFARKHGLIQLAVDSSRILGLGAGISFLVLLMAERAMEVGAFGAGITALQIVQDSFSSFLIQLSLAGEKVPFVSEFFKFLETEQRGSGADMRYEGLHQGIEVNNLDFAYHGTERNVLKDININIKKGETIALIGENGAGKTTLVKLLIGLYKPTRGSIRYDGTELDRIDMKSLYPHLSAIYQDYVKYKLTLRENVGFGDISEIGNDEKIIDALKEVEIDDLLHRLPEGLDSRLGREFDGAELSIGQWQKIAIARGIMGNGDLVVMDEPTASLDPMIEASIFKRFAKIARGRTAILVSHRVGSARMADRIIVLQDGRVVEEGSHDELIKRKGRYYELYNLQAQWYR